MCLTTGALLPPVRFFEELIHQKKDKTMNITNGRISVEIDENGAIARIMDVEAGHAYFDACEADRRLFHLVVPSQTWSSRSVTAHESILPEIIKNEEGCLLRYDNMEMEGKPTGISAEVSFKTPAGTDEIQISLKLVNNGNETVTTAIFPWINGWQSPGNSSMDRIMPGPHAEVDSLSLPKWACAWGNGTLAQEHTRLYPISVQMPWIDFSGENGGVSCINYQRKPRLCFAAVKNMAGHEPGRRLGMLWGFYAYVPPGSDWESPVVGISVHDGDWHQTADRYRKWMNGWFAPASSKREFRESIGSEHVYFNYFDGTPVRPYESLPAIAAAGRKYGVRELCVWDRLSLGTYGTAYLPDEDMLKYNPEDRQAITQSIHKAVAGGTDVSALVNFRLMNPSLDVFCEENLESEMQLTLGGTKRTYMFSMALIPGCFNSNHLGPHCNVFSPFSEKYRQRLLRQIQAYLDLGYTSLFYDQPFEAYPDYSRKESGGIPEMTYAATLALIRDVRKKLREKNPNAVIMGEQCDVFGSEIIDQWMTWKWSNQDIASAIRVHYSIPQTVINCVVDREPGLASHAFAAGLHLLLMTKGGTGILADVPEFAEHIRKLAELRKRCANRTVHARFCDTLGLSIETNDKIVAYSYESKAGPAVIIAAPEQAGKIQIHLDRTSFDFYGDTDNGQLFFLNGNVSKVTGDSQEFKLDKHDVLIWIA